MILSLLHYFIYCYKHDIIFLCCENGLPCIQTQSPFVLHFIPLLFMRWFHRLLVIFLFLRIGQILSDSYILYINDMSQIRQKLEWLNERLQQTSVTFTDLPPRAAPLNPCQREPGMLGRGKAGLFWLLAHCTWGECIQSNTKRHTLIGASLVLASSHVSFLLHRALLLSLSLLLQFKLIMSHFTYSKQAREKSLMRSLVSILSHKQQRGEIKKKWRLNRYGSPFSPHKEK